MDSNRPDIRRKVVIVGDTTMGKTALVNSYHRGAFLADHIPTVLNNFCVNINTCGKSVELAIHDTAGLPEYSLIRSVSYPKADVILLCVALDSPSSLEDVPTRWISEIKAHCPRVPIILVGTKKDLRRGKKRSRNNTTSISTEEGQDMAIRIGASGYFECSARSREGVEEVMEMAARLTMMHRNRRRTCVIL